MRMREDSPMVKLYSKLNSKIFASTSLARSVIGNIDSIMNFKKRDLVDFRASLYKPENTVFVISGNFSPQPVFDIVNKYDNLRRPTIITMHRKVAVCLVGHVVRPPKTLQEILDAFIKLSKNASLLAVASPFCF